MYLETAIALTGLGILIGFAVAYIVAVRPLERKLREDAAKAARELRLQRYRQTAKHHGTPYIAGGIREW